MLKYILYFAACAGLGNSVALAQNTVAILPESFVETKSSESLVSVPFWLRGLQFASAPSGIRPSLQVAFPNELGEKSVCLQATTIDGRLLATGQYRFEKSSSGLQAGSMVELKYPTDFPEIWSVSTALNSGLVLSEGACAAPITTQKRSRLLPVVFNGVREIQRNADDSVALLIAIHARNTQELLATLTTPKGKAKTSCTKIESTEAIQFNFLCEAAIPGQTSGLAELSVIRINRGREASALRASILLPAIQ
ncbi:MAG: hypothetical protein ABJQ34_20790 [Paracoccaceae bacterium]